MRFRLMNKRIMNKNPMYRASLLYPLVALLLGFGLTRSLAIGEVSIPLLKTSVGEYRNVKIFSRTGTHLSFSHEKGTAVIKVSEVEDESLAALDQTRSDSPAAASPVPGAMVMLRVEPKPKPDPAWLAKLKQTLGKLQLESTPVELTRKQAWEILGGLALLWWLYSLSASLICKKTGNPGGLLVWLPIFQIIPLFRAAGMSAWWFVAMFIPVLNLVGQVVWCVKVTQARGKGFFTAVLLILPVTNILAFLYLAFSNGHSSEENTFVPIRPPHALAVN